MNDRLTLNRWASSLCEPSLFCHAVRIFFLKSIEYAAVLSRIFLLPLYFTIIVVHLIAICCKLGVQKFWQVNSSADKVGVEDFRGCS